MISSRELRTGCFLAFSFTALFFWDTLFLPQTYFAGDLIYYWFPRKHFISETLQAGQFPLWDPYFLCGIPFFANPDNAVLDPLSLVFHIFHFALGLKLFHLFTFFLAFLGVFLISKKFRLSFTTSIFAALIFVFGGYFLVRSQFLSQCSTLLWCVWAVLSLVSNSVIPFGIALSFAVFAGHWQTSAIFFLFLIPLILAADGKVWITLAKGGFLAAGLSVVQWLPAWEWIRSSFWGREGLDLEFSLINNLRWSDLSGFIQSPSLLREFSRGVFDNSFWIQNFHLGFIACVLAVWGFVRSPKRCQIALGFLILFSIFLSMGGGNPFSRFLYETIPFLSFIRYPSRWILGAVLGIVILSAASFEKLSKKAQWVCLSLSLGQLFFSWGFFSSFEQNYFHGKGSLAAYLQNHLGESNRYFLSFKSERMLTGFGPNFREQAKDLRDRLYLRLQTPFHISNMGGYGEPLTPIPFHRFLQDLSGKDPKSAQPYLSRCGVSDLLIMGNLDTEVYTLERELQWNVYHNRSFLPRLYWIEDEVFQRTQNLGIERKTFLTVESKHTREKVKVQGMGANENGWLIFSSGFHPGWVSYVNGKKSEIQLDGGIFSAVQVPKQFSVNLLFRPFSFRLGLIAAALTFVGLAFFGFRGILRTCSSC